MSYFFKRNLHPDEACSSLRLVAFLARCLRLLFLLAPLVLLLVELAKSRIEVWPLVEDHHQLRLS